MTSKMGAWANELSIHTKIQFLMAIVAVTLISVFSFLQFQINSTKSPATLTPSGSSSLTTPVSQQNAYPVTPIAASYDTVGQQSIKPVDTQSSPSLAQSFAPPTQSTDSPKADSEISILTPLADITANVDLPISNLIGQQNDCNQLLVLTICT